MQMMRYINLLDKASSVRTRNCFVYNNTIFFAVPKKLVSKAIGPDAINVKRIQESLRKKVKIIIEPQGPGDISKFVESVVSPNRFKSLEIKENVVVLCAGSNPARASLIGRNKTRLIELEKIILEVFGMGLKII